MGLKVLAEDLRYRVAHYGPLPFDVFLEWAWQGWGTGRNWPDQNIQPMDWWSDRGLAQDLVMSGLDVPVLEESGAWPLPWPEFNRRAKTFLRCRTARRASVRKVIKAFCQFDAIVRDVALSGDEAVDHGCAAMADLNE